MKQQLLHRGAFVLLPLLLGALLGGVKWKQLHPTPTQFDLQERAHLREAKIVELVNGGKSVSIPIDEFKATLDEFYLLKRGREADELGTFSGSVPIPRGYAIRLRKSYREPHYLAQIHLSSPAYYTGTYLHKSGIEERAAKLHPVTERRLREFIALYRDDK